MKKIVCRPPSKPERFPVLERRWTHSAPFAVNSRGVLVHRVRSATTYLRDGGKVSHTAVQYWCGNTSCNADVTDDPPEGRILCYRCEAIAVSNGEQPADEIIGRHIHKGGVRAYKTCCTDENN